MHAGHDVAAGQPLQLAARLDEEAAVWDAHRHPPPVAQPHEQAREPALAVQRLRAPGIPRDGPSIEGSALYDNCRCCHQRSQGAAYARWVLK